jgi:ribonucleoside-diphosphate reductase alpha chain
MVNDSARRIIGGGNRRAAIWAGLHWNHLDIFDWIVEKDWPDYIKVMKKKAAEEGKDQDVMAPLDMTNISVILDTEFFEAYDDETHPQHELAHKVYWTATAHMVAHGEPGFSIDTGDNEGENLRNACTEITSADDSDVCNLGSINLARIKDLDEFKEVIRLATLFLLAGTVYSDVPHHEVVGTREKNRRLGLGLMGLHEWLLVRGYRYEMVPELRKWLEVYAESTEVAGEWADKHILSRPVKTRAIAPTGTIGIIGETTTGTEPLFCVAYKRRFLDTDMRWKFQYVIDPIAHQLIEDKGVDSDMIEDAYSLSYNVERRIYFQAELQGYVDHAIASTINLPYPITNEVEVRDFGETLMQYLPRLRGVTCYPDGARAGQPLEAVPYEVALGKTGVTFDDNRDNACASGSCGV